MTKELPKSKDRPTGIRELKQHEENPYAALLTGEKKARREILYDGNHAMLNTKTGEVEDSIHIARVKWVEPDQFVKVYLAQHGLLFDLSKAAQRCCEYLMSVMGQRAIGRDHVALYHEEFEAYFKSRGITRGLSPSVYNSGIRELADKKLIARSKRRDNWYINPTVFFNGDRARITTEYRKKQKSQQEMMEDEGQQRLLD